MWLLLLWNSIRYKLYLMRHPACLDERPHLLLKLARCNISINHGALRMRKGNSDSNLIFFGLLSVQTPRYSRAPSFHTFFFVPLSPFARIIQSSHWKTGKSITMVGTDGGATKERHAECGHRFPSVQTAFFLCPPSHARHARVHIMHVRLFTPLSRLRLKPNFKRS